MSVSKFLRSWRKSPDIHSGRAKPNTSRTSHRTSPARDAAPRADTGGAAITKVSGCRDVRDTEDDHGRRHVQSARRENATIASNTSRTSDWTTFSASAV